MRITKRLLSLFLAAGWLVTACLGSPANAPQADQNTQVIEVSAKKYKFSPSEIRVMRRAKVELKVHSADETHGVKLDVYPEGTKSKDTPGLLFDQPGQNGKVTKGVDQVLDFTAQEQGTYDFKCAKVCGLGHDRMKGKLIVEQ